MWGLIGRVLAGLNLIAAFMIVGLMLLITADVIGRAFFFRPISGVPEIVKLSIVCIAWLQMAYTLRMRHHLRSTLILGALPVLPRRTILVLNCLAGALMMALIAYYSYPEMLRAWRTGAFEGERPVRVPTWPIWGIVVLGSALTALEFAGQAIQSALGRGDDVFDATGRFE
jgi:TRAP-type C4-dicarboxylate transport system permease small subunit